MVHDAVRRGLFLLAIGWWFAAALPAQAESIQAIRPTQDFATYDRAKKLEAELRCLVCQGQSIAESDSGFADDIRFEINRMIADGSSDAQIKTFLVERYGDFILFRPPLRAYTRLLWVGPGVLVVIALGVLYFVIRRRRGVQAAGSAFSDDERRRAEAMLSGSDQV
jgi:cytochrome c-type biogenesis protein CcmH